MSITMNELRKCVVHLANSGFCLPRLADSCFKMSLPITYFWESLEHFPQVLSVAAIFFLAFYSTSCDFHS